MYAYFKCLDLKLMIKDMKTSPCNINMTCFTMEPEYFKAHIFAFLHHNIVTCVLPSYNIRKMRNNKVLMEIIGIVMPYWH